MSEKQLVESKISKWMYTLFPILLSVFLLPFMMQKVPYHTDLAGNVDGVGSRWVIFIVMSIISGLFYYLYSNLSKRRILFSLILSVLMCLITLFLLASVVQMENLFSGFANYLSGAYGNQMSFTVFLLMMLLFITVDIIPRNYVFGIRNSVALKTKEGWRFVHVKTKPIILCCSIANLYIFLLPNMSNRVKMFFSFATVIVALVAVTAISQKYKSQSRK